MFTEGKQRELILFARDLYARKATYWHDVERRARELNRKIRDYQKSGFSETVIVTIRKYKSQYSRLFHGPNVAVIMLENLREIVGGKIWAGRGSLIGSLPKLSTDRAPAS
jgi:hypothetical protein